MVYHCMQKNAASDRAEKGLAVTPAEDVTAEVWVMAAIAGTREEMGKGSAPTVAMQAVPVMAAGPWVRGLIRPDSCGIDRARVPMRQRLCHDEVARPRPDAFRGRLLWPGFQLWRVRRCCRMQMPCMKALRRGMDGSSAARSSVSGRRESSVK